jgi:PUA domain protein
MPEKFRRHFLKSKDAKDFWDRISKRLKVDLEQIFGTNVDVEVVETEFAGIYLIDGKPLFAGVGGNVFPTLVFSEFLALAPRVVVDMGAVSHVCNGANVMAPGIVRFEGPFEKGDFVVVVDEKHGKALAIGEVLYDVVEAEKVERDVVVRNVHFVGDKVWNFIKLGLVKA